jgi:tetratricopeptide (TPR) repeat protein
MFEHVPCWMEYRIACLLVRLGRIQEASTRFRSVTQRCPDHLNAHNDLAWCLSQIESYEEAIPHRDALKLGDQSGEPKARLARASADQRRPEEALRLLEDALVRDQSGCWLLVGKSGTLLQLDRPDDALAVARLAVEMHRTWKTLAAWSLTGDQNARDARVVAAIGHTEMITRGNGAMITRGKRG